MIVVREGDDMWDGVLKHVAVRRHNSSRATIIYASLCMPTQDVATLRPSADPKEQGDRSYVSEFDDVKRAELFDIAVLSIKR